jgi:hypothetical protein
MTTHILCSNFFFRKSCRLYEVEKYGTARQDMDHNTIRFMLFACWTTMAENKHSERVIRIDLQRQQWLRERASMLRLHVICLLSKWLKECCNVCTTERSVRYSDNRTTGEELLWEINVFVKVHLSQVNPFYTPSPQTFKTLFNTVLPYRIRYPKWPQIQCPHFLRRILDAFPPTLLQTEEKC